MYLFGSFVVGLCGFVMFISWDKLVLGLLMGVFGEVVIYMLVVGGVYVILVVFDDVYFKEVMFEDVL